MRLKLPIFLINFQSIIKKDDNITLSAVFTYLQKLPSGMKSLLSQVIFLPKLLLVATVTNTSSELSFCAMWWVKSYLQSMMGQHRLNNIMVLHVHNKDTNKPDLIIYANDFVDGSETHLAPFWCFDDTEWGCNNVPAKTWSVHVSSIKF